jgi:hypothetical protein
MDGFALPKKTSALLEVGALPKTPIVEAELSG